MAQKEHPSQSADIIAYEMAIRMLSECSPFGPILALLHELAGPDGELDGFAELALGIADAYPEHALNAMFEFLVETTAWRRIQPRLADELRELGICARQAYKTNIQIKPKNGM